MIAGPVVEIDFPFRGFGGEVGRDVLDLEKRARLAQSVGIR
jgi:hypothetical protein